MLNVQQPRLTIIKVNTVNAVMESKGRREYRRAACLMKVSRNAEGLGSAMFRHGTKIGTRKPHNCIKHAVRPKSLAALQSNALTLRRT